MKRETKQRRAIRETLRAAGRPLAPEEILQEARRKVPTLGIATVYRAVNSLEEEGWATSVELPEGPVRFERAGKGHHHHFLCTACEGVWDVDGCSGDLDVLTPSAGFQVDTHEILLYGQCDRCAA